MESLVYNIPISLVEAYRGRRIIVRFSDPSALRYVLTEDDYECLQYVQSLTCQVDLDALADWGGGIPIDLVMADPGVEFSALYNYARLLDKHPVRVTIPVTAGLSKAVKVAASLNFAVKLEPQQPSPELIDELSSVLGFFLHHSSVSQPIDYFHSLLLAFYNQQPATLWGILEEDPAYFRYVTDEGEETISRRFVGAKGAGKMDLFFQDYKNTLMAEGQECCGCEFVDPCAGYFKWPDKNFACNGVKTIFHTLKVAAVELQNDLSSFPQYQGD